MFVLDVGVDSAILNEMKTFFLPYSRPKDNNYLCLYVTNHVTEFPVQNM